MIRLDEQYPALSGGVAERPRAQQDMGELLSGSNVWYDPSKGLTRRPAMRLVSQATNGTYNNAVESTHTWGEATVSADDYNDQDEGTVRSVFELAYEFRGEKYALFVQKEPLGLNDAPVYAVRKSDGRRIVSPIPGTGVATALTNGVNAAAVVGDLLVLAPRATARHESHPTYTVARPWAVQANQQNLAAWVRGGAFARPYKLTLVRGDSRMWVQYTTLSEAYPAKLDTSDIPTTDPEYSKKVNDRTNAYNSAATAWLAAALADITPENIATRLAAAVTASGYLAPGSTAVAVGSSVLITDPSIEELFVEDGGDGSLIMAAGNTIPSAASVVAFHLPGKILKVLPGSEGGADSFYLKAVAKDQSTGAMTQVSWEECAGEELVAAAYFVYGAIAPAASPSTYPEGRLYLERSIAALNAAAGTEFPEQLANVSGDMTTNPPPAFYSREVSAMAAFQDRLVMVCAGGAVSASQPGDYLNFFRTSMLTSLPRDPVNFTIIGGEGDTVRHAVKYDRNLLLVGAQQYMIPGRNALVPGQAAASIYSSVPGMDTVEPVVQSGMVFFARYNGGRTTVHAMLAGRVVEDPQVVDLTAQAPDLITQAPVRLVVTSNPEAVLVLTQDPRYCYLVTPVVQKGELRAGTVWPWELSVPTDTASEDICQVISAAFPSALSDWTTISGNAGLFTESGGEVTAAAQTSVTEAQIHKAFSPASLQVRSFRTSFKVLSVGADDTPTAFVCKASLGQLSGAIAILPTRESVADSLRRPLFYYSSDKVVLHNIPMGHGQLTTNVQYRFECEMVDGAGFEWIIEDLDNSAVWARGFAPVSGVSAASSLFDGFGFAVDSPNPTGSAKYKDMDFSDCVRTFSSTTPSGWSTVAKDTDVAVSGTNKTVATITSGGSAEGMVIGAHGRRTGSGVSRAFQVEYTSGPDTRCMIGLAKEDAVIGTDQFPGSASNTYGYHAFSGNAWNNGSGAAYGATYVAGDKVLVVLTSAGAMICYKWNGSSWSSQGTAFTGLSGVYHPAWGTASSASGTRSVTITTRGIPGLTAVGAQDWE